MPDRSCSDKRGYEFVVVVPVKYNHGRGVSCREYCENRPPNRAQGPGKENRQGNNETAEESPEEYLLSGIGMPRNFFFRLYPGFGNIYEKEVKDEIDQ